MNLYTCIASNIEHWILTQGLCGLCLQTSVSPCSRVGFTYLLRYSSVASLEGKGPNTARERKRIHVGYIIIIVFITTFLHKQLCVCMCEYYLQFGNINLISLTAARNESLPWSALFRSDMPYFALRLGKKYTTFI